MEPVPASPKPRIFFPNLDGLRFISFFVVLLYHWYLVATPYLESSNPEAKSVIKFLFQHGSLGVNFFFVLSGFLITYLLVKEKEMTGTIQVGKFYVRRILRIWPLYYMMLVIAFVIFPYVKAATGEMVDERVSPLHYIFFAANFEFMRIWPERPDAVAVSVLWSVAIEEQFYLVWPLLLRFIPVKWYKYVFPAIMLFSLVFRSFYTQGTDADHAVRYFHTFSVIGDMALGGLFAWWCSYPSKFLQFVTNLSKPAIAVIYAGAIFFSLFMERIFVPGIPIIFERLVIGFFFGMIILEQNYARNSFFKLGQWKLVSKLGTYTYGLYCLHLLAFYIATKIIVKAGWDQTLLGTAFIQLGIAMPLSIFISLASYHLFEKWFLRLKDKFAFITK